CSRPSPARASRAGPPSGRARPASPPPSSRYSRHPPRRRRLRSAAWWWADDSVGLHATSRVPLGNRERAASGAGSHGLPAACERLDQLGRPHRPGRRLQPPRDGCQTAGQPLIADKVVDPIEEVVVAKAVGIETDAEARLLHPLGIVVL